MGRSMIAAAFLFGLLAAASAAAAPSVSELLSLKPQGMGEGDRLQNAVYCLEAGRQAREGGQFGTALDLLSKCLELDSEQTEVHLQKALLFADDRVGLHERAVSELRLFLATNPTHGHAWAQLGWEYRMNGRVSDALEQFKTAAAKDPADWWTWERYGELLIAYTDRVKEGVDAELNALSRGDPDPFPHMFLAQGYFILGRNAEARASATRAVTLLRERGMQEQARDMIQLLGVIEKQ